MSIKGYRRPILSLIHAKNQFPTRPPAQINAAIIDASSTVNFASNGVASDERKGKLGETHPQAMPYVIANKFTAKSKGKNYLVQDVQSGKLKDIQ